MIAEQNIKKTASVLVVDDEENIRYVLNKILTSAGYNVTVAPDAATAHSLITAQDFNVALVDRILSTGPDGIEVIRQIRSIIPCCEPILMSAYPTFQSAAKTLEHQAFAYLTKPMRRDEICSVVAAAAERSFNKKETERYTAILNSIFSCSPNPIIIYDLDCRILFTNKSFTECFEYTAEEVLGNSMFFVPEQDTAAVRAEFSRIVSREMVREREQTMLGKNGQIRHTSRIMSLCSFENKNNAAILVIIRDITETKKLEHQLLQAEKTAVLGQLSVKLAHEINNPLQAITGYTEFLIERDMPEDMREYLKNINTAALKIRTLSRDLADVARPRPIRSSLFPIEEPLEKAISLLQKVGQIKRVEILRHYQSDIPQVCGDSSRLEQVFMNLIFNASHAMLDMPEKILRFTTTYNSTEQLVRIAVSDTGCGIPSENLSKVFDPFFTTKQECGGTGLGLSVVKTIIEEHGGSIHVESVTGGGATFIISFPVQQERRSAAADTCAATVKEVNKA